MINISLERYAEKLREFYDAHGYIVYGPLSARGIGDVERGFYTSDGTVFGNDQPFLLAAHASREEMLEQHAFCGTGITDIADRPYFRAVTE